jgi:DNA-3-methyladenine glycosylase II
MPDQSFSITPSGPFSLAEAATFGFGQRQDDGFDGVMRLAFCVDGYDGHAGVEVRQDATPAGAGTVHCTVLSAGPADPGRVRRQVARVLSLDHDGAQFMLVGERDPVIGALQAAAPGLRPPLFYSPYEAAAWSVLSSRRPARQMMGVRDRLSQAHGPVFELAGRPLAAFPAPAALLAVESFPDIPDDKMRRLHGVASAALEGCLDAGHLQQLGPEAAMEQLQAINGIGPFYSSLIVIRGTGFADVLAVNEPRALALVARLYGLDADPSPEQFRALAEPWRPFRTWAVVLIRAAGGRILDERRA